MDRRVRADAMTMWERFWFRDVEPHAYALLRIGLAFVGLLGLIGLTPIATYWPADGLIVSAGGGTGLRELVTHLGAGTSAGYALYVFLWCAFLSMLVGFRSSAAVAACFIGSALQGFWNPLPLSSSHKVLVALLFCLMWADTGRVLSVDAWRNPKASTMAAPIWPLRLIRLQMALIYVSSGLTKLSGESWRDGSAVHYVLQTNAFHRFPETLPVTATLFLTALTYATVVWELAFAVLILNRRTRALVLWFGVIMHLGMATALEVGTFSVVMLVGYIAFVDPLRIARLCERWTRAQTTVVSSRA